MSLFSRERLLRLCGFVLFATIAASSSSSPSSWCLADKISDSETRLADSANYLASDKLEGRGLTTKGINLAADYIVERFRKIGLKTDVFDGSPFQEFSLVTSAKLGKANSATLIGPGGKEIKLKLGGQYTPMGLGGSGKLDLPLVFVGYGATAKKFGYDDFAGIDVKGKAVIILRKEPQQGNLHSKFDGKKTTQHSFFKRKISNAYQNGAKAVILVNDHYNIVVTVTRYEKLLKRQSDQLVKLKKEIGENKPDEKQAKQLKALQQSVTRARAQIKAQQDPLMRFTSGGTDDGGRSIPVITLRRAVLDQAMKAAFGKDLETIERDIDKDFKPHSAELKGWKIAGNVDVQRTRTKVKNVVGVLEGFGPLAKETVVIGAHYDHLGYGERGSLARGSKEIHNGADDNGSGTATLIEIAHEIAGRRARTRYASLRRIVFIAFTAEERGLLGSAHYVKNPAFEISNTVAMLNLDMVGRLSDDKLIIQGIDTAKEFGPVIDKLNKQYAFKITRKKGGTGPSDHTSFYVKNVPVMHFFTGTHKDYHRPSDDFDKLNIPGMRRIGEMIADLAMSVATTAKRPTYVKIAARKSRRGGGDRPYLGTIPDFAAGGEGYKLMGVTKGGPSENAGLKAGDSIIQFDKYKISGLEDIDGALRKFKAGDKVKVTVLRDGKKVVLEVILGVPR